MKVFAIKIVLGVISMAFLTAVVFGVLRVSVKHPNVPVALIVLAVSYMVGCEIYREFQ